VELKGNIAREAAGCQSAGPAHCVAVCRLRGHPGGSLDANPPGQGYGPVLDEPTEDDLQPSRDPTKMVQQREIALAFGKSYTWDDRANSLLWTSQSAI
jgi:hypothetical protein